MRDTTFLKKILDHEALIMKITSHNKTFEWRLRLVEWRYAQAALLGTALDNSCYPRGINFPGSLI